MKNIHLIKTDKPSRLYLHSNNELQLRTNIVRTSEDYLGTNQHIYITNSEKPKAGDWCYNSINNTVYKKALDKLSFAYEYKIILTDNKELIKDGVQLLMMSS